MDLTDLLPEEPDKADLRRKLDAQLAATVTPHPSIFRKPVGIQFLADVSSKQPKQIAKRLERCPVAEWSTHQGKQVPKYDFMTAIAYLIRPRGDVESWFAQQNQASLPPQVSKAYWDSVNGRIRAMRAAGQLWHDDDVMAVFGRAMMLIKGESQNWVEELPGKDALSNEQYNVIVDLLNNLLVKVKEVLVDMPRQTLTQSMAQTIKDEIEEAAIGGEADNEQEV